MRAIESAEDISFLAFGFMASKALFAALHVDVFGALAQDGPSTAAELAEACDVPEHRMETLVTALVSVGMLVRDGDLIANAPAAETYMVRDSPSYFGDYLRFQIDRQMYPFMQNLDKVLVGETDGVEFGTYADWMADPNHAELFSRSQHSGSLGPAAVLAKRLKLEGAASMLDVGGGSGAFSIMFCKRYPELKATVLDFPNVIEVGRTFVAEEGLSERIAFLPGDGTNANWPNGQDVVLMSYLFSGVPGDAIPKLCADAYRVLKPGGRIVVHDFMVGDERTGPPLAALWQLQHMVYTPDGVGVTPGFARQAVEKAGFREVKEYELIPGMTRVIEAVKA